jgi:hypothetical protein
MWPLVAALGLATALRLRGLRFGLPHRLHWDEPTIVNRAVRFGSGDLNPRFFAYPTAFMYLLAGEYGALYMAQRLRRRVRGAADFAATFLTDPTTFYVLGRATTAACGIATVGLTYALAERTHGRRVATAAALLLATNRLHAGHSKLAVTDVPMTALATAAHVIAARGRPASRTRDAVAAGAAVGLAASMKYTGAIAGAAVAAEVLLDGGPRRPRAARLAMAGLAALVSFLATSPFVAIDRRTFWRDISFERRHMQGFGDSGPRAWSFYGPRALLPAAGLLATVASIAGLARDTIARPRTTATLYGFPLLTLGMISSWRTRYARYALPVTPFQSIAAASGFAAIAERLPKRWSAIGFAGLVAAAIAKPLVDTWRYGSLLRRTDPRVEAARWIERHVPAGTAIAVQPLFGRTFFGPPLQTDRTVAETLGWLSERGRLAEARPAVERTLAARPTYRHVDFAYDVHALRETGAEYVAISSHVVSHHRQQPRCYERELAFYARLWSECEPPVTFEAEPVEDEQLWPVTPPTIWLFALTPSARRDDAHKLTPSLREEAAPALERSRSHG